MTRIHSTISHFDCNFSYGYEYHEDAHLVLLPSALESQYRTVIQIICIGTFGSFLFRPHYHVHRKLLSNIAYCFAAGITPKRPHYKTMSSNLQWPKEVLDKYEPVRILGKGGFASVFLAKRKSTTEEKKEKFVAIKLVRAKTKTETHYAHREINILKEINHPNIMKLIESWEPDASTGIATMAVTYARGRTLHYLLKNVGAPSLTFSRVVIAQLVDAVSHLHSVS